MKKLTIKEIKEKLQTITELESDQWSLYEEDSRKGVQQALRQRRKQIIKEVELIKDYHKRLLIENHYYSQGVTTIAGVDEVGRGPIAGPVVACAVILPKNTSQLIEVKDSKQLSHEKRKVLSEIIKEVAVDYKIAVYDSHLIDQYNIYEATKRAMKEAVEGLKIKPDRVLIDAMTLDIDLPQESIIKGDDKSLSIASASILAKVYRDEMMMEYAQMYPEFGFNHHMGYGTKEHLKALECYGYTPIHRHSFSPVSNTSKSYYK